MKEIVPFLNFDGNCFDAGLLLLPDSEVSMASDNMPGVPVQQGNNLAVMVHCESLQEIDGLFAALGREFGVRWMFNFAHPQQA
jgi:uncharacterized glyoxalase superfamily protein PhnB